MQKQVQEIDRQRQARSSGPMGHALVTTNPLLPKEQFVAAQVVDQFELDMNKDAKYSLLDCPGKYTRASGDVQGAGVHQAGRNPRDREREREAAARWPTPP